MRDHLEDLRYFPKAEELFAELLREAQATFLGRLQELLEVLTGAHPWGRRGSIPLIEPLLQVEGLKTWFETPAGTVRAVDGVDFEINPGETFVLLGESGCGKSMTALSVMRLIAVPPGHIAAQRIVLDNRNLLELPERAMRKLRGRKIAMIFQEPQTSLNPVFTIGDQIGESLRVHVGLRRYSLRQRVLELLEAVGIPHPRQRIDDYPHQFSGGMRQRVMIAMALAGEPELLIADEPTTALDVTIQAQILELLKGLQRERGLSILLITHDLGVVSQMADRIGVMYAGHLVEQASRERFFTDPLHPYSRKLFEALPTHGKRDQRLNVIQGSVPPLTQSFKACRFADRCDFAWEACRIQAPKWILAESSHHVRCHLYDPDIAPSRPPAGQDNYARSPLSAVQPAGQMLLKVEDLKVYFPIRKGILRRMSGHIKAVDGVSLEIRRAETLALVGESGCGKTTTGKGILQLLPVTAGSVRFNGEELTRLKGRALRQRRADFQVIFQDPFASMNPRMTVADIVEEGMIVQRVGGSAEARQERVAELLQRVGLPAEARDRYPHEFSGGQRQRICIARALAVKPKLIVCDEPTSALDVSVQAQILNLLREIQHEFGLSYLFITHNLAVVEYLAHRIAVMYLGRIVEEGTVTEVLQRPQHSYTKTLLAAVPSVERD